MPRDVRTFAGLGALRPPLARCRSLAAGETSDAFAETRCPEGFPRAISDLDAASDGSAFIIGEGQHVIWHLGPAGRCVPIDTPPELGSPTRLAWSETDQILWVASDERVACRSADGSYSVVQLPDASAATRYASLTHVPGRRAALVVDDERDGVERGLAILLTCGRSVPDRVVELLRGGFVGVAQADDGLWTTFIVRNAPGREPTSASGFMRVSADDATAWTTAPELLDKRTFRIKRTELRPAQGCDARPASDGAGGLLMVDRRSVSDARLCRVRPDGSAECVAASPSAVAGLRGEILAMEGESLARYDGELHLLARLPLPRELQGPQCSAGARRLALGGDASWVSTDRSVALGRMGVWTMFTSPKHVSQANEDRSQPVTSTAAAVLGLGSMSLLGGLAASRLHGAGFGGTTLLVSQGGAAAMPAALLMMECSPWTHRWGSFGSAVAAVCQRFAVPGAALLGAAGTGISSEVAFGGVEHTGAALGGAFLGALAASTLAWIVVDPLVAGGDHDKRHGLRLGVNAGLIGAGAGLGHELGGGGPRR